MINGAHAIIYSKDASADRAFFRDVLAFPSVDVGEGWLIFKLPDSEVAFHPSETGGKHELFLMTDDIEAFVAEMAKHDVTCPPREDEGWGILTSVTLPGGGSVGVYQPRHDRP